MPAATQNRNTPTTGGLRRGYPVAATALCLAGTLAVIDSNGLVQPGSTAAGLIAVGIFESMVDNSAGAAGEQTANVLRTVARLENSADAEAITAADIGQRCYIVDNQTVAKTSAEGSRSVAGIVDHVDEAGVWVLIDPTSGALIGA